MKAGVMTLIIILHQINAVAQYDTSAQMLDEVILTSQRYAQTKFSVPYSIQSVNQSYLENYQPRTAPEALTGVNGVFVQKTNHGGGSPFLRGLTGNQTLILVDGIRLNNSTFRYGPNQYLNTIDPYTIGKIEVAKGTGSVQYGTDALGGVIQVFTKEPQYVQEGSGWSGRAVSKYMSGDMEKTVRGEAGYATKNTGVQIGATYRNFGDLIGGDTTGRQSPSGYKVFSFDAKAKFRIQDNYELTFAHQFLRQQHVPVYHRIVLENFAVNEFDPQQRMLSYARLEKETKNNLFKKLELIASWQHTTEGRNSRKNGSTVLRKELDEINTLGFSSNVSSQFSKAWSSNSGIEMYTDKVNSMREDISLQNNTSRALRGLYPDASRYTNLSVYSLHHFNFSRWAVEGGVRYNIFSVRINDTTLGDVQIRPSAFVYNAALMYNITTRQRVYITVSSGYRAPNIDDMGTLGIVDFRYEVPTASLKPEKSLNTEIGYKFKAGKWSGTAAVYYMHLSDLIARIKTEGQIISGYQVYAKENIETAYIKGVETELNYDLLQGLTFTGNLAYSYGRNATRQEPLRRIPPLNGRVLSSYRKQNWFASAELLYASAQNRLAQGDKEDNRIPQGGTPGWNILNLYTGYQWKALRFNTGLQNMFNKDYRTHGSGINGAGRSVWLSVAAVW